ncbi:MAG: omptin family outer membrane protease [Desulfatiglandales bacterium]
MRYFIIIITAAGLLGIPSKSPALDLFTEIGLETRYVQGDSTYRIGGVDSQLGSWASELEFPLNNIMAGISLIIGSRHAYNPSQTRDRFSLTWLRVVQETAGTMKDSDWVENDDAVQGGFPHAGRDIYTESDAQLRGTVFDVNYAHHFRPNNSWSLGPMIGYRSQYLEYDIYGYSGYRYDRLISSTEKALEYEITYKIPYLGLSSDLIFGKDSRFQLHFILAYSDWAKAEDRDDHVLRYKLSESDCEGEAYLIKVNLDWQFYRNWLLGLGAEYVDIDTSGMQHQSFYAGPFVGTTYDVNNKITSTYWSTILKISYAFR